MNEMLVNAIQNAADLIRAGKLNSARPLLTDILKVNDQIEQAWFLLSYTLSDNDKCIYALDQAININPEFHRAIERLEKLQAKSKEGKETEEDSPDELVTNQWNVTSKLAQDPNQEAVIEEGIDQEIIEQDDKEHDPDESDHEDFNLDELDQDEIEQDDINEIILPFYESAFIDADDSGELSEEDNGANKKFSRFQRLLLAAFAVAGIVTVLLYFGQLNTVNTNINGTPGVDAISTLSQGFRTLPPTWTPGP